jgi:hypothetical protein
LIGINCRHLTEVERGDHIEAVAVERTKIVGEDD